MIDFDSPRYRQLMLPLSHVVVTDVRRRCVCFPDRMSAEVELNHLRHQHGVALLNPRISKNGKGKSGTYTVAYTLRQSHTERLF